MKNIRLFSSHSDYEAASMTEVPYVVYDIEHMHYVRKIPTDLYIEFSANGSGILLVNEGYINTDGIKVSTGGDEYIILRRDSSKDVTLNDTIYYAYYGYQYGAYYTTTDLSGYSKNDTVEVPVYLYDGSEMSNPFGSDIEVTITKYDSSYTGPNEQLIEYETGDNQKVKVNSTTVVSLSDRLGPDGTPNNTTLTSIIIPSTVTYYGEKTFKNSTALETVIFEEGTTTIYEEGFRGCHVITTVTIPGSITSIEAAAFEDCESLNTVIYNGTSYTVKSELLSALEAAGVTVGDEAFDNTDLEEPTDTTTIVE